MSKTIIITTEEMANIIEKNFLYKADVITDVHCEHCRNVVNGGVCPHPHDDEPCEHTDFEVCMSFVNIVFANYMIPFS